MASDGFCDQCGEAAKNERDHWSEQPLPWVGGVCDRGIRHTKNEDAMALAATDSFAVLVVCDGVSTAPNSDVASLAAARAARDLLHVRRGTMAEAGAAANEAIIAAVSHLGTSSEPPSCTFVAATVERSVNGGAVIECGWVGDSRGYWFPDAGEPVQLSIDDSWMQEMLAIGSDPAEIERSPHAHAITRWLGPDSENTEPRTASLHVTEPGWLLLCSDGVWNYAPQTTDLRHHVPTGPADPVQVAEQLVAWANECGGQDNITAALVRVDTVI